MMSQTAKQKRLGNDPSLFCHNRHFFLAVFRFMMSQSAKQKRLENDPSLFRHNRHFFQQFLDLLLQKQCLDCDENWKDLFPAAKTAEKNVSIVTKIKKDRLPAKNFGKPLLLLKTKFGRKSEILFYSLLVNLGLYIMPVISQISLEIFLK